MVDCTGLENRQGASLRGFESHPFRQSAFVGRMRHAAFVLLAMATLPAEAAWLKMGEVADAVLYVDLATLEKTGRYHKIATLDDLKVAGPGGEISLSFVREFDCNGRRVRVVEAFAFSGPMASGRMLGTEGGGRWQDVVTGTTGEDILRYVCGL